MADKYIRPGKNTARKKSLYKNTLVDTLYKTRLYELAMARFDWNNVPEEIDVRFLEMSLNRYGVVAFFKDKVVNNYICLPCMTDSEIDIYNNPKKVRVYASNGYTRQLTPHEDCVIIYNNMVRTPTFPVLDYYAEQLYEVDQTRIVNIKAQKTPVLIRATDKQRLSLQNLYLNYEGNEPVIFVDDSIDKDQMQALNVGAPFLGTALTDTRRQLFGEALVYLGYSTQESTQKKERLLSGELTAANAETAASRFSPLLMRREAVKEINKMYGLDIEVNFRQPDSSIFEMEDPFMQYVYSNPGNITSMIQNQNQNKEGGVVG